jgi:hypothetical protein
MWESPRRSCTETRSLLLSWGRRTDAHIEFTRYYRYNELTGALKGFAEGYSSLATLESIGKSYEGRDIWCMAITTRATGPDLEKPALWLDGNLHATEVRGARIGLVAAAQRGGTVRGELTL